MPSILIYTPSGNTAGEHLTRALQTDLGEIPREVYKSVEALIQRLRLPLRREMIAVLFPGTQQDLMRLTEIQELLRDLPIILILPDQQEKTVSWGHALRPRFLTGPKGDFSDVTAVMAKMLKTNGKEMGTRLRHLITAN